MSPDLEWRVEDEGEHGLIARTSAPRPPRWHKLALLVVVVLGLGLGLVYTLVPEPPQRPPAPTPPPTPTRAANPLEVAIRRDVIALADDAGEDHFDLGLSGIETLADEDRASWYYDLLSANGRWGRDANPLFKVQATGTLPDGTTWVEVQQARRGVTFRQTRFYRLEDQRWQMQLPSRVFWGGQLRAINTLSLSRTVDTVLISFELLYPIEDESLVPVVADRFSRAFKYLCIEFVCPIKESPSLAWGQPIALTVSLRATAPYTVRDTGRTVAVTMPSPRVTGYYEVPEIQGDPIESMAFDSLLAPTARLAAGYAANWPTDQRRDLLLNAIIDWLRVRVFEEYELSPVFVQPTRHGPVSAVRPLSGPAARVHYTQLLHGQDLLPLEAIWHWQPDEPSSGSSTDRAVDQAEALIAFLDQRYGSDSVIRFLRTLGTADSLPLAIERTLAVNYSDFVSAWEEWIGKQS